MPTTSQELAVPSPNTWYTRQVEGGRLFWSGIQDSDTCEAFELLHALVSGEININDLNTLSRVGSKSRIHEAGSLVIKYFGKSRLSRSPEISGLPYLRASIDLNAGLVALEGKLPAELRLVNGVEYSFSAPSMYGSFVPNVGNRSDRSFSIMSRADGAGTIGNRLKAPPRDIKSHVFDMALVQVGIDPCDVFLDPYGQNIFLSEPEAGKVAVCRLDVEANSRRKLPSYMTDIY